MNIKTKFLKNINWEEGNNNLFIYIDSTRLRSYN